MNMRKELKIGIAGIAALAILIFGINYLKGINLLKSEHYYNVDFTNVNGLTKSSPVFSNGFQVGIVKDISYDYSRPGHIVVGIDIDEAFKMPVGSSAELVSDMLGNTKMDLLLNHKATTYLQAGDTILGKVNMGLMGKASEELVPQVERILPKLDSILTSVNTLLANPALKQTLENTAQLTASLNSTSKQLDHLMKTEVPIMTQNLTALTTDLKKISGNLQQVDYAQTFQRIEETLRNVQLLTNKLNSQEGSLGLLLNDPSLYNNLNSTMENAASLLKDLETHPKRYVHFSIFGKKDKKVAE